MKCCNLSKESQDSKEPKAGKESFIGIIKHTLMMLTCCLAPLGIVYHLQQSGYDGTAKYLILLLCPLTHLFMMKKMGHVHRELNDSAIQPNSK